MFLIIIIISDILMFTIILIHTTPGKMEMELHSTLAESRDALRKQDRLDRVRYEILFFISAGCVLYI